MSLFPGVATAVIAAGVLFAIRQTWKHRREVCSAPSEAWERMVAWRREPAIRRLRRQVLARAAVLQIPLPVAFHGHRPRIVTYSDNTTSHFFPDRTSYQSALTSGRSPLDRSVVYTTPPDPIATWSAARLKAWLEKNPPPATASRGGRAAQ